MLILIQNIKQIEFRRGLLKSCIEACASVLHITTSQDKKNHIRNFKRDKLIEGISYINVGELRQQIYKRNHQYRLQLEETALAQRTVRAQGLGSDNRPLEEAYGVGAEKTDRSFDNLVSSKHGVTPLVPVMMKEAAGFCGNKGWLQN